MNKEEIEKVVADMDEETELAFISAIIRKRVARLEAKRESRIEGGE